MVCGNNPLFGLYARIIETAEKLPPIPRFRDMYTREHGGTVQIVLYTRTGGGNRPEYHGENEAITRHALYVENFDDDFDTTFAHWVFTCPPAFENRMLAMHKIFSKHPKGMTPRQKFKLAMGEAEAPEFDSRAVDAVQELGALMMDQLPAPSTLEIALSESTRLGVPK